MTAPISPLRVLHLAPASGSPSGIAAYGEHFREGLALAGVATDHLPAPAGPELSVRNVRSFAATALRRVPGVQVVHAELGGGALAEFYAALAISGSSTPVVVTVHDPPRPVWFPFLFGALRNRRLIAGGLRRLSDPIGEQLEKLLLRRTSGAFSLSSAGRVGLLQRYPTLEAADVRVLTYPLGPHLRPHTPSPRLRVVFHGYWYAGKGIEDLLTAAAFVVAGGVDLELRLWGDVSATAGERAGRAYREQILSRVCELGLEGKVTAPGHLPNESLFSELAAADVMVLAYNGVTDPTILASTSAAMHDALAAGTPVFAANVRSLNEVIVEDVTGALFEPGRTDQLAALLRRAYVDREWLQHLQASTRKVAMANSRQLARCGAQARAMYEEALASTLDRGVRSGGHPPGRS